MSEPIEWLPDGTPYSPRFSDRYHSESGGRDQAELTFLAACGLPEAWAAQPQWRILETGFGFGLNFLTTWAAWKADPQRPRMLHFVSIEAYPVQAEDLLRSVPADDDLRPLAEQLTAQWWGLLPGVHRLSFEHGQVLLTIYIGDAQSMLRKQQLTADSVFLDGFSPKLNPELWSLETLKSVTRHCRRGTRVATWCVAGEVRENLKQLGFDVRKVTGIPPKRHNLQAAFNPQWQPKRRDEGLPAPLTAPTAEQRQHCLVLGAGLAGAAAAASLARRGWQVTVLDAAAHPAAGASGLPAGLFCPHVSPDDSLLSRLSRSGVRCSLQALQQLTAQEQLQIGSHWQASGVLEHDLNEPAHLPAQWLNQSDAQPSPGLDWSLPVTAKQLQTAGLPADSHALWHSQAGWVRPAQLVRALLQAPSITWQGNASVARLEQDLPEQGTSDNAQPRLWRALDASGHTLASAPLLVLALGPKTTPLLQASGLAAGQWEIQPIRGQVSVSTHTNNSASDATSASANSSRSAMPPFPVNGHGNLVPDFPVESTDTGAIEHQWVMGSTFERDVSALPPTAEEQRLAHASNGEKLAALLPSCRQALSAFFDSPQQPPTWSRVRAAAYDRIPVMGPVGRNHQPGSEDSPGLWVLTGLGSRGLTLSLLCAELLTAQLHDEPLPLDQKLAAALGTRRLYTRLDKAQKLSNQ